MELFKHNCFHLIDQYQLCNSIFEKCLRTLVMSASIYYITKHFAELLVYLNIKLNSFKLNANFY
jgi:hypothetical protein